ncbi:hypothetical protein SUGI_0353590 [Cryptomeria japonica]|uniref:disease resistance RPP13-like protein 4 n=1 Tax=Cryptomeria japonica TaxID=3369 RepID=UPI002408B016|nr:disease resistance RPP13-like protein 4 [Cryptomeria japonica]GLJ19564.1 hypothetical protein SUGI_0353590 [Cryptomeria japonica]
MAEGHVVEIAKAVVGKLGEIVVNEAKLVLNFREDFEWLQTQLTDISGYLQAADQQSALDASTKRWLTEVSDIALDAEDIVDECAVEPLYTRPTQSSCFRCFSQSIFQRKMGKRIKDLKDRMSSAIKKAGELSLVRQVLNSNQASTSTSERERGMTGWNALEEDSREVGVEQKVKEIERLLEDPAVGVVAVVGMGGLGKTFLLKNVYDRIKGRYDHPAWISVSETYSLRKIQSDLASNIDLQINDQITDFRAAELIQSRLHGKTCLIVLDDVWKSSVDGNLISRLGLPTGRNNKCQILVTSRSRDVAAHLNAYVYEMQLLSKGNSLKLFCLFAFPGLKKNRPPEHLESVADQIVEECGRLPLAVKTIAASLASCSDLGLWESKLRKLKDVAGADDSTMQILKLSYTSLPPYLKARFAYFSFFPEDTKISFSTMKSITEINQEYLINLWIAEGFIPQEKDTEQYDNGLTYLQQLRNLCLFELDRVGACYTVHDLFVDLVVNISKEHKCEFNLPVKKTSCRRLLLSKQGITTNAILESSLDRQRSLRTISFSHNPDITSIPKCLFDHLRVLRIVDFSSTTISTLPKCVGRLKLLKVLNLSHTKIRELPHCVRRLKSLEYLDVSGCTSIQCLPNWIGELKSLSHLDINNCSEKLSNSHVPKGISNLVSLRTLRSEVFPLSIKENQFLNVKDVGNLINLQEISFRLQDIGALRSVEYGTLEGLVRMRVLLVQNDIPEWECRKLEEYNLLTCDCDGDIEEYNLPAFPKKMNVMKDLQQLGLCRFSVPSWICDMVNLTELSLVECTGYKSLKNMPNLQTLTLMGDSRCRQFPKNFGASGGFPKLVKLRIVQFRIVEELPALEVGAMQRLQLLHICDCPWVKKVPKGFELLTRLKRIVVDEASDQLMESLKEGGEDWNKIKANNFNIEIEFL